MMGAMSAPAFAGTSSDTLVNFTNVSEGHSSLVTISGDGGASTVTGYAGRYVGKLGSQDINDFCVDLNHDIPFGTSYTADVSHNISDASGAQDGDYFNGGLSSALDNGYYSPSPGTGLSNQERANEVAFLIHNYGNSTSGSFNNGYDLTTNMTGVSLAIWDIEADGADGLGHGTMVADSGTTSTYGSLVDTLESQAYAHRSQQFLDVKWIQAPVASGGYQSFGYLAPVPEAGTVSLFGLLLAGGALRFRSLKKKQKPSA